MEKASFGPWRVFAVLMGVKAHGGVFSLTYADPFAINYLLESDFLSLSRFDHFTCTLSIYF